MKNNYLETLNHRASLQIPSTCPEFLKAAVDPHTRAGVVKGPSHLVDSEPADARNLLWNDNYEYFTSSQSAVLHNHFDLPHKHSHVLRLSTSISEALC